MLISSIELILNFAETAQLRTPARAVFQALGGELEAAELPREPGATLRSNRDKRAIRWEYTSTRMTDEDVDDVPKCVSAFVNMLERINEVAPIGEVSRRTLTIYWILPVDKRDFKELEGIYRDAFIRDTGIFSKCVDSAVVVDMEYDTWRLHHQSGAMTVAQLQKDFRAFPVREQHPKLFLFLETTVTDDQVEKYSEEATERFMKRAVEVCRAHSDSFSSIMEGVL